jgi:protein involved in polysaccharide export with SLBB domain
MIDRMKPEWPGTAALAVVLPAAVMMLASCASKQTAWDRTARTEQQATGGAGFGGQTYESSVTTTSTVVSVDAARRTMELRQADGTVVTYKAGPEVAGFDQLKAGDRVRMTVAEARTVSFAPAHAALSDRDTNTVVRPPDGGPITAVNSRSVTAKILSVSYWDHSVSLQMADGKTMTVKANAYTNLAEMKPGDKVSVRVSEARTFTVEK